MIAVLQQVSDALATTVATVSPGIVRVEAQRRLPASGLVCSGDGIMVTTHHIIEQDDTIRIGLHSGQTIAATRVDHDAPTELASHERGPRGGVSRESIGVGPQAGAKGAVLARSLPYV